MSDPQNGGPKSTITPIESDSFVTMVASIDGHCSFVADYHCWRILSISHLVLSRADSPSPSSCIFIGTNLQCHQSVLCARVSHFVLPTKHRNELFHRLCPNSSNPISSVLLPGYFFLFVFFCRVPRFLTLATF